MPSTSTSTPSPSPPSSSTIPLTLYLFTRLTQLHCTHLHGVPGDYNLTMLDAEGAVGTAHVGPGRTVEFSEQPCATNHRWRTPLDPGHAARFRSVQRLDHLDDLLDHRASADDIALSMLQKPLYSREFSQSFGTLFTADYRPAEQSVTYHWPELSWTRTFDSPDATVDVVLADA